MQNREEWIAKRAYELWETAGKPVGQDHEHWRDATGEWENGQNGSGSSHHETSSNWDDESED